MENMITLEIPKSVGDPFLPDPTLLDYYKDAEDRIYWLEGEVDDSTLDLVKTIMRCNKEDAGVDPAERKPIKIFIDTVGGDVQVMWTLINAMKISQTPVHTIVYCTALSAGAHILAAGHRRFAFPGATILVHSGSRQFSGDAEKVEATKRYYDNLCKKTNEAFISDTNVSAKDLKRKGAAEWYISAEEAVELGIVDAIVSDFCEVL